MQRGSPRTWSPAVTGSPDPFAPGLLQNCCYCGVVLASRAAVFIAQCRGRAKAAAGALVAPRGVCVPAVTYSPGSLRLRSVALLQIPLRLLPPCPALSNPPCHLIKIYRRHQNSCWRALWFLSLPADSRSQQLWSLAGQSRFQDC